MSSMRFRLVENTDQKCGSHRAKRPYPQENPLIRGSKMNADSATVTGVQTIGPVREPTLERRRQLLKRRHGRDRAQLRGAADRRERRAQRSDVEPPAPARLRGDRRARASGTHLAAVRMDRARDLLLNENATVRAIAGARGLQPARAVRQGVPPPQRRLAQRTAPRRGLVLSALAVVAPGLEATAQPTTMMTGAR